MGAESGGKICSAFFRAEGENMRRFWSPSSSCSRVAWFFKFGRRLRWTAGQGSRAFKAPRHDALMTYKGPLRSRHCQHCHLDTMLLPSLSFPCSICSLL